MYVLGVDACYMRSGFIHIKTKASGTKNPHGVHWMCQISTDQTNRLMRSEQHAHIKTKAFRMTRHGGQWMFWASMGRKNETMCSEKCAQTYATAHHDARHQAQSQEELAEIVSADSL